MSRQFYFVIDRNHGGCNGWSELREDVGRQFSITHYRAWTGLSRYVCGRYVVIAKNLIFIIHP